MSGAVSIIYDSIGEMFSWVPSNGGQVAVNGVPDPTTSNVVYIYYDQHTVMYGDTSGRWFSKQVAGQAWVPMLTPPVLPAWALIESADLTRISQPYNPPIINAFGETWTLMATGNGQVAVNGLTDATTANVDQMVYHTHLVYYQNSLTGLWLTKSRASDVAWVAAAAPPGFATVALSWSSTTASADQFSAATHFVASLADIIATSDRITNNRSLADSAVTSDSFQITRIGLSLSDTAMTSDLFSKTTFAKSLSDNFSSSDAFVITGQATSQALSDTVATADLFSTSIRLSGWATTAASSDQFVVTAVGSTQPATVAGAQADLDKLISDVSSAITALQAARVAATTLQLPATAASAQSDIDTLTNELGQMLTSLQTVRSHVAYLHP